MIENSKEISFVNSRDSTHASIKHVVALFKNSIDPLSSNSKWVTVCPCYMR
jgi:hypothetical protein